MKYIGVGHRRILKPRTAARQRRMFVVALSLRLQFEPRRGWKSIPLLLILVAATVLLINPVTLARIGKAGYSIHSDHKGAADFIHSIHPHLASILVA
jgi:hypothetical protein